LLGRAAPYKDPNDTQSEIRVSAKKIRILLQNGNGYW